MELWVRSQNKEILTKVNELEFCDNGKNNKIIMAISSNNYHDIPLGKYETKERALEVLDEIQEHISNNYAEVYEMPEE